MFYLFVVVIWLWYLYRMIGNLQRIDFFRKKDVKMNK